MAREIKAKEQKIPQWPLSKTQLPKSETGTPGHSAPKTDLDLAPNPDRVSVISFLYTVVDGQPQAITLKIKIKKTTKE